MVYYDQIEHTSYSVSTYGKLDNNDHTIQRKMPTNLWNGWFLAANAEYHNNPDSHQWEYGVMKGLTQVPTIDT